MLNGKSNIDISKLWRKTFTGFVTARKRSLGQGNIFRSVCQEFCWGGGYPSMHCRWYPNMPCSRSPGGRRGISACLAGFQAHTQGGSGRRRVSRTTPKGEVEGDLARGWGYILWGGVCRDPPWWLLLRAVRILLECILVFWYLMTPKT